MSEAPFLAPRGRSRLFDQYSSSPNEKQVSVDKIELLTPFLPSYSMTLLSRLERGMGFC